MLTVFLLGPKLAIKMRKPGSPKKKQSKGKKNVLLPKLAWENTFHSPNWTFRSAKRRSIGLDSNLSLPRSFSLFGNVNLTYRHDLHLPRCHPIFIALTVPGAHLLKGTVCHVDEGWSWLELTKKVRLFSAL